MSTSRMPTLVHLLRLALGGAVIVATPSLVGCSSSCPVEVQSFTTVRVFDRQGRVTSAAVVTANGANCPLDRDTTPNGPRYTCTISASTGADELEIQAVLEGRKATTVIASLGSSCAGTPFPNTTLDLTP